MANKNKGRQDGNVAVMDAPKVSAAVVSPAFPAEVPAAEVPEVETTGNGQGEPAAVVGDTPEAETTGVKPDAPESGDTQENTTGNGKSKRVFIRSEWNEKATRNGVVMLVHKITKEVRQLPGPEQSLPNQGLDRRMVDLLQPDSGATDTERQDVRDLLTVYSRWPEADGKPIGGRYFLVWAVRALVGRIEDRITPPEERSSATVKGAYAAMAESLREDGMSEEGIARVIAKAKAKDSANRADEKAKRDSAKAKEASAK